MKKLLSVILAIFMLASLAACASSPSDVDSAISDIETESANTSSEDVESEAPLHSEFFIEGLSVEDVIMYFNEVCLNAEYINSGNPTFLQKWAEPITFKVYGDYTQTDYDVIYGLVDLLNEIEGFPGISEALNNEWPSLNIHFCEEQEFVNLMGEMAQNEVLDGAVTFWYNDNNEIYDAIICCRSDIDQNLRNSVILEEIYNGLGPIQDTTVREDSIIYQGYSEVQKLTEIDTLLLKLLYHPQMKCGMDAQQCETVIRQLYY